MKNSFKFYLVSILFTLLFIPQVYSQKPPGYIGKLNFFGVNVTGSTRLLAGLNDDGYEQINYEPETDENSLNRSLYLFRNGLNLEYFRIIGRNVALGIKFQSNKVILSANKTISSFSYSDSTNISTTIPIKVTSPEFRSFAFKPSVVFNSKPNFLPVGFRHTLSIGPRFVSLKTGKDYFYEIEDYFNNTSEVIPFDKPNDNFTNKMWGIDISYNKNIIYPINDYLIFEFGFEFRTAFLQDNRDGINNNRKYFQHDNSIEGRLHEAFYNKNFHNYIKREVWSRIFSFNIGLIVAF